MTPVAIGILVRLIDGRPHLLVTRRKADVVLAGYWEFPGGKIEPGEDPRQCVAREFVEEVNLQVTVGEELPAIEYTYPHGHVRLHPFLCEWSAGEPENRHVVEHRWIPPAELTRYEFPPANATLIAGLMRRFGRG